MTIRRKSTTHDLATLRLHPDGSRVQQSSVNSRHRTAGSTVEDFRGNWIALDAGGRTSVKKRRSVSVITDEARNESIKLSSDEEGDRRRRNREQTTHDGVNHDCASEDEELNTRTKRRLSFFQDFSFLNPPTCTSVADIPGSQGSPSSSQGVLFPDPAPELLKCVHHFASSHYRERGQLFDSSREYRGRRKERSKPRRDNIHFLASDTSMRDDLGSQDCLANDEEDWDDEEHEEMDVNDDHDELPRKDFIRKDMYKAFDGSALMAIGILLQEQVAHILCSGVPSSNLAPRSTRQRANLTEST